MHSLPLRACTHTVLRLLFILCATSSSSSIVYCLCPEHWTQPGLGSPCFSLNTTRASFAQNQQLCSALNATMLYVQSHIENRLLQKFLFTRTSFFQAWLGAQQLAAYQWTNKQPIIYENWSLEYANSSTVLGCLVIQRHGVWAVTACDSPNVQVCQALHHTPETPETPETQETPETSATSTEGSTTTLTAHGNPIGKCPHSDSITVFEQWSQTIGQLSSQLLNLSASSSFNSPDTESPDKAPGLLLLYLLSLLVFAFCILNLLLLVRFRPIHRHNYSRKQSLLSMESL